MVVLNGHNLRPEEVYEIAISGNSDVSVAPETYDKINVIRNTLEKHVDENRLIYGVTTSFGEMVMRLIPRKYENELQVNLVRSHVTNAGDPLPIPIIRAIMIARANCLAYGNSGIKQETLTLLVDFINKGITPFMPEKGTVGASGDLGPLSHIAINLIGEGECWYQGQLIQASVAMEKEDLKPLKLGFKEGLALINGTSASTGLACINLYYANKLIQMAHGIASISLQALDASTKAFDERGQKPHYGQKTSAMKLMQWLSGSKLVRDHSLIVNRLKDDYSDTEVTNAKEYLQDAYSLRCTPQILGAVIDTWIFANQTVTTELNSPNDNPLFFEDGDVFHGGNYHGQYTAFSMDYLSIALTQAGNLSERRLNRLLDKSLNKGLPEFLTPNTPGLSLGLEGLQYVSVESCAENRTMSTPASIQSISSNEENQDVVPMAWWASRKCFRVLKNLAIIEACEAIAACQAVEFRGIDKLSPTSRVLYNNIRQLTAKLEADRPLYQDINRISSWLMTGIIREV